MCGIVGKITFSNTLFENIDLKLMADTVVHRGPDGEGFWINNERNIGFGLRRFSIIDLSKNGK